MAAPLIPVLALTFLPLLQSETQAFWPDVPLKSSLAAQVQQESKWNPKATNKNPKNNGELGIGFGQITRTNKFDNLTLIKKKYKGDFDTWSWDKPYQPKYEMRALVIMDRDNYRFIKGAATPLDRLAFTYSAYNGGLGGVQRDRLLCSHTKGCDKSKWFGNVEKTSYKARTSSAAYKQSFYAINREYVRNILITFRAKYAAYFKEK